MNLSSNHLKILFIGFLLILGMCYWPGVSGGFIFDDSFNLRSLGAFGPVDNWQTFLLYITSGNADPTGRPASMLSFLWDAHNWPAAAAQFKQTNILIHLLNAALLFRVLQIVERKLGNSSERGTATAALGAALWAAHPFFVSTTLYIIQRHAMLPLTFTLLAWLCWAQTEKWLDASQTHKAWLMAIFGVWGITVLAGLSKANGFLAPLLILISISILNTSHRVSVSEKKLKAIILVIPSIAICLYLLLQLKHGLDVSYGRDFTLGERLLTQPRILFSYLSELFVPGSTNSGFLTGDTITVSKDLFHPPSTFFCLVLLVLLNTFALKYKEQFPRIAIAITWFFVGHLVESSSIMLELYFEHRNYMPSAFLFLPIAFWLTNGNTLPLVRKSLIILLPTLLLFITLNKAIAWGNPEMQARIWNAKDPSSFRNLVNAASAIEDKSALVDVINNIKLLQKESPDSINLSLGLIGAECQLYGSSDATWDLAYHAAKTDKNFNAGIIDWLTQGIRVGSVRNCKNFDLYKINLLLNAFFENPAIQKQSTSTSILFHLKGFSAAHTGDFISTLDNYNKAAALSHNPNFVLTQAAMLGNNGHEDMGIEHIRYYRSIPKQNIKFTISMQALHSFLLSRTKYFEQELDTLEKHLQAQNKHKTTQ